MPLDSLGLGLTLDTTLLEKADKALENMAKNSKLVMQNLTRGITAFNEGKIADFTQVLGHMSSALDKLSKTEVSPDFDTTGQDKFIDRMQHIMSMMEKMSKIKGAKFYDPTEVYATDKDASDILAEMQALQEYKKELAELVNIVKNYVPIQQGLKEEMGKLGGEITEQEKEVKALSSAYDEAKKKQEAALKAMAAQFKAFSTRERKKDPSLTDEQLLGMFASKVSMQKYVDEVTKANEELVKAEEKLMESTEKLEGYQSRLNATQKEYKSNIGIKQREDEIKASNDLIKEQEKILQAEMKYAQATEAERAAMLTKRNEAEIKADQKRIRDVQKSYEQLRKEIQKGEKDIADLEASRQTFKESNRPTKGIDNEIKRRRNELNKLMQDELEFRSSEYWPKLQAIDEKFNSEAFVKNQKALAKLAAKESRKDVTSAIQYSRNAQTINEEKEAIKRLVEARDNLSTSTARYKKTVEDINKRILAHKDHIEAVTRVEKEQNTLADSVINRYRKQLKALDEINDALEKKTKIEHKASVADLDPNDADTQSLLARQKTIADDIAAIEKQAQGELDVIKEQHEAERAKKRIDETIKTNEREKQEYAKLLDEKYALEKQKKAMEAAGAKVGDKSYDYMLAQEKELDKKILQLEQKHQVEIAEIHLKHLDKKNQDEVREFIATQKEKQRIAEETQKKIDAYNEKYGTVSKQGAEIAIESYKGAKNIVQHKQAIEDLQRVRAKLDNTDKDYFVTLKKIDKALRQHHKALEDAGVESNNLMQSHRGLLNIGGQLARRLALAFSVSQLTQYFRKLVEVRGQFEKTEVALTSIIGDSQKAQKLMNQTISLAIKSPFTLQQLTGYTKQLAAYQVSYEELHSTTKMLADVSAGLGVEMDRLILAFGQVKAANYLRATEVRQFTEAGFNILGELADYYNELEGTMLSVGDVQEMVTKRMVDFEDVAEVFKRVTQEGGMFYEMQSKQAETLAGQWTNLQDRIDVMLNEIGSDKEGMLKGLVSMLASLIDNWEGIADVIKIVVGAFVLYKANLLAVTKSQIANNIATQESIKLKIKEAWAAKSLSPIYKNLSSSMKGFGSAMKSFGKANLWLAALTAVIGSIVAITKHVKQMNEALAEQDKGFNENTASLLKLSEQYKKVSKGADAYNNKIKVLQELSDKLEDRNLTLSVKIEEVDKNNIDKIFEENTERLQKAYEFGKDLGKAIARGMNEAQGNFLGISFFGENLKEDAEDYGQSMGKLMSWGMQVQMKNIENAAKVNYGNMSKYAQEYYDSIKDGKRANESEYEWTKRRATALVMISKLEGDIVGKNKELQKTLRNVVADGIELHHETKGIYDNLVESAGGLKNLRKEVASNPIEMAAQIKTEVDKLDYDPATKQFIINDLYAMLHLKVNYVEDPNAQSPYQWDGFKKDLKESRDDLKKFVDENNKSLGYENFFFSEDEIKKLEEFSDALEAIQKLYDENNKTIKQLDGTSDAYSKAEKTRLEALQSELKEVAAKWNYDLDAKNKKGDNDALKRLKDQIKLIKDANKAYEERNKKFGKEESQAVVSDSYKDAFKKVELAIEDIDYTNLEGVVKALEDLEDEAKKAGGEVELLKAISEVKAEIGLTLKERQDKELFDQVQQIFDNYELAVDIKKLGISPDLAKNLFGVDTKSFDQMREEIISKFAGTDKEVSDILSKGTTLSLEDEKKLIEAIGKDRVNEAKEALDKIRDLEESQQIERLKMYSEYAKKGITKRANIKLEELRKLQEIEETFTEKPQEEHDVEKARKEGATEEEIARLEEENKLIRQGNKLIEERNALRKPTKDAAIEGVKKESKEQLQKLDWEEFEKSDTFIRVFDDLDSASTSLLNHLIDKIQDFKDEWTDMPLEDVEKIIDTLNKLQTKLAEAQPWKEYKKAKEDLKAAKKEVEFESPEAKTLSEKKGEGGYMAALDLEDILQQKKLDGANKEIALLEVKLRTEQAVVAATDEEKAAQAANVEAIEGQLQAQQNIKSSAEKNLKATQQVRSEHKRVKTALAAQYSATAECFDMAVELGGAISDMVGALTDDDPAAIFGDMALQMLSTVANTLALQAQLIAAQAEATALGLAMNTAAGVIGWIVMAIQLLVTAISAAVNYADKMRQMDMDVLAGQVDNLKNKFDNLAESMEEAWSYRQLEEYSKELDKVQTKMVDTQKQYVQLLKSGKDGDTIDLAEQAQAKLDAGTSVDSLSKSEKKALLSEEYQAYKDATDALAEMEENYAEQKKEMLEELGGITNPKDAAEEFVDAWLDAYKETGDGLSGLDEKFDEFFENLIKKKAAMIIAEKALTGWVEAVNDALDPNKDGGYDITDDEQKRINVEAERAKKEANDLLLGIFEGIGVNKEGGLSGLQKGIQGITEDQADILAAYWNSVRGYTASIDSKMDMILANMNLSAEDNPMLAQLMMVAKNTSAINTLLSSLVKSGHTLGGSGIKVFMS